LWGVEPSGLAHCFPEMRSLLERCRFPDCLHLAEPDCAVRAAVESGLLDAGRYESYRRLLTELLGAPRHWE
jgi:ribosome biogenesis GTPase